MHKSPKPSSLLSSLIVSAIVFGLGAAWSGTARAEEVACYIYDDNFSNIIGPYEEFYIAGPGQMCIVDLTGRTVCRKWFGLCSTKSGEKLDTLFVFNDDYRDFAWDKSVYVPGANQACIPDGTAKGTCRRWFGMSDDVQCYLFDDGPTSFTGWTDALYYNGRGQVCLPDGTASGTCRKWFRCAMPE